MRIKIKPSKRNLLLREDGTRRESHQGDESRLANHLWQLNYQQKMCFKRFLFEPNPSFCIRTRSSIHVEDDEPQQIDFNPFDPLLLERYYPEISARGVPSQVQNSSELTLILCEHTASTPNAIPSSRDMFIIITETLSVTPSTPFGALCWHAKIQILQIWRQSSA
jgi:hypothetical protein